MKHPPDEEDPVQEAAGILVVPGEPGITSVTKSNQKVAIRNI
jgi:hypothetical protein